MPRTYKPQGRREVKPHCALCNTPLNEANGSKEHVIPNALGGRKAIRKFICKQCNNTTGATWDNELAAQLQPLCTMLNIRRFRGRNQPVTIETVKNEKFLMRPDGSLTIPKTVLSEQNLGDDLTQLKIRVRSIQELKKMMPGLKRKYPKLDINKVIGQAASGLSEKEYSQDPWSVSLQIGGNLAGRSIVKSCLALAYEAGLHVKDCEHAKSYLVSNGEPCFGYYNETDVVTNRPARVFFHCIFVCGDPSSRQILGYAEYFGYQRIVACLSSNYDGDRFSCCYAIDPVTGRKLNIDVHLNFTPEDISAIYAYEKVGNDKTRTALSSLLRTCRERSTKASIAHAVEDAMEFASSNCGVQPGEMLSDEQVENLIGLVQSRLEPFMRHLYFSRTFSPEDLQNIAIKSGYLSRSNEIKGG